MAQPRWVEDDDLMADLGEALKLGQVDDEALLRAARGAFVWRTVDEELATLAYDSLVDAGQAVRDAGGGPRILVFEAGSVSVELQLGVDRIIGQLVPPAAGEIVVESEAGEVDRTTADDAGCFTVAAPRNARVRLRCRTGSGNVVTDWVHT